MSMNNLINNNLTTNNLSNNNTLNDGDLIETLPVDKDFLHSDRQIQIANTLFRENEKMVNVLAKELKESLIICLLFILFCLPQVDTFIRKIVPKANDSYVILMGIKCIGVILAFYIIKNFNLTKKQ